MDFELFWEFFVTIWDEFSRVRNRPIMSKSPALKPMVFNMADFDKCQKLSKPPRNEDYMLENGFPTVLGLVRNDLGRILKGPKSADFEKKKPWL